MKRNLLVIVTAALLNLIGSPVQAQIVDPSVFEIHAPDALKEKSRQSEYYKSLALLISHGDIVRLHQKLHKEVFSARPVNTEKLFEVAIFLEDETNDLRARDVVHAYLLDLHATTLQLFSGLVRLAKTETEADRQYSQREFQRYVKAALIRVAQWKILAEEDAYKCKHNKEALAFLKANLKKYGFDQELLASVGKDPLSKIALDTSAVFKNRPANEPICKMSQQFRNRLKETGTPMYITEQKDGSMLVHMETEETPVTDKSKMLDAYINTGMIKPEYVAKEEWLARREKIRSEFSKTELNRLVLD